MGEGGGQGWAGSAAACHPIHPPTHAPCTKTSTEGYLGLKRPARLMILGTSWWRDAKMRAFMPPLLRVEMVKEAGVWIGVVGGTGKDARAALLHERAYGGKESSQSKPG